MLLDLDDSQLVLMDYQARLLPAIYEGDKVLANARRLGQLARLLEVRAFATEQNPAGLGASDAGVKALCSRTLVKTHFSACAEGLTEWLRPAVRSGGGHVGGNARSLPKHLQKPVAPQAPAANSIVIAGCEAHVCLLQTALDLLDEEFEVWIVTDACGSISERDRDAAFDRLVGAGAELLTTQMVAFEWLRTSDHPLFQQALAIIKS